MLLSHLSFSSLLVLISFQLFTTFVQAAGNFKPRIIPTDNYSDVPVDIEVDPLGRPLVSYFAHSQDDFLQKFHPCVMRLLSDGTVDSTFRKSGKKFLETGFDFGSTRLLLQPDGKSVILGFVNIGEDSDFGLARFNKNGELDSSFGHNGIQTTDLDLNSQDIPVSAELLSDGKILVAGNVRHDGEFNRIALARYLSNGKLDGTFGNGGRVFTDSGFGESYVDGMELSSDGKIRVSSYSVKDEKEIVFTVRYLEDGSLDRTFGADGILVRDSESPVVDAPGEKSSGEAIFQISRFRDTCDVRRYHSNGSPDFSFGLFGIAKLNLGCSARRTLKVLPNGKVVVAGTKENIDGTSVAKLARLNSDGTLDTSFGASGYVTLEFPGLSVYVAALALSGSDSFVLGSVGDQQGRLFVARVDEKGNLGR